MIALVTFSLVVWVLCLSVGAWLIFEALDRIYKPKD
jgi:hypothetical protein